MYNFIEGDMHFSLQVRTFVIFSFFSMWVCSSHAAPQDIFSYGLQSHGTLYQISQYQVNRADITGSIRISGGSHYRSSNGALLAENIYFEETKDTTICGDQVCNPIKGVAHKLSLPDFPFSDSGSDAICIDDSQCGTAIDAMGLPDDSQSFNRSKTIAGRPAFYIDLLKTEEESALYLQPGDYWIKNADLGKGTKIVADTSRGVGTIRIFLMKNARFGSDLHLNSDGNPNGLFLYSQGDVELNGCTVNGYIYSENIVKVDGGSSIVGAINARHIDLNSGSELIEDLQSLQRLEWKGFNVNYSVDKELVTTIENICPGYSGMSELPAVAEDSNCVATNDPAELLSETGCFRLEQDSAGDSYISPVGDIEFSPGVVPYVINSPLWSDGARKSRAMVLPKGTKIIIHENGDWEFPLGSILIKNFEIYGKRVETRFLMRVDDGTFDREGRSVGSWYGYSYEWNEDGSNASLLTGKDARHGKDRWVNNETYSDEIWRYPGQDRCFACHGGYAKYAPDHVGKTYYKGMINVTNDNIKTLFGDWFSWLLDFWWKVILRADYPDMNSKSSGEYAKMASLGPETAQLNLSCVDPETGVQVNQFSVLKNAGAFTYASTVSSEDQKVALDKLKIVNPYDSNAVIEDRARSYLYVNCASCHHGTLDGYGPGTANYDFRVGFDEMKLLRPNSYFIKDWSFGIKDNLLVFPGSPESSIISTRLHFENGGSYPDFGSFVRMPFKSTTKPDNYGIAVIDAWIKSGLGFSQFEDLDGDGYAECLIPGMEQNCLAEDPDRSEGDVAVNFHRVFGY